MVFPNGASLSLYAVALHAREWQVCVAGIPRATLVSWDTQDCKKPSLSVCLSPLIHLSLLFCFVSSIVVNSPLSRNRVTRRGQRKKIPKRLIAREMTKYLTTEAWGEEYVWSDDDCDDITLDRRVGLDGEEIPLPGDPGYQAPDGVGVSSDEEPGVLDVANASQLEMGAEDRAESQSVYKVGSKRYTKIRKLLQKRVLPVDLTGLLHRESQYITEIRRVCISTILYPLISLFSGCPYCHCLCDWPVF